MLFYGQAISRVPHWKKSFGIVEKPNPQHIMLLSAGVWGQGAGNTACKLSDSPNDSEKW